MPQRTPQPGAPVLVRLQPGDLAAIDAWRRAQPDLPSRPEAIRRLCNAALAATVGLSVAEPVPKVGPETPATPQEIPLPPWAAGGGFVEMPEGAASPTAEPDPFDELPAELRAEAEAFAAKFPDMDRKEIAVAARQWLTKQRETGK